MLKPENVNLTFLIIANQFWSKGSNLIELKKEASHKGTWKKGAKRKYHIYLVHKDTVIDTNGRFEFPSEQSMETALYLGIL